MDSPLVYDDPEFVHTVSCTCPHCILALDSVNAMCLNTFMEQATTKERNMEATEIKFRITVNVEGHGSFGPYEVEAPEDREGLACTRSMWQYFHEMDELMAKGEGGHRLSGERVTYDVEKV